MKTEVLDDFTDLSAWMPVASGLAELEISPDHTADGSCTSNTAPSQPHW